LPAAAANTAPTAAQQSALANQYAQLQVDPQLTALQNQSASAQTQEQGQISQIQAANSQLPEEAQTMLTNAGQQAQADAAARGAGTSGVYDYDEQQLQTPIMEQVNAAEAQSTASQQAAVNQLATTESNIDNQQTSVAAQQGQLASQYAESLNEYYTSAQNSDLQGMLGALTTINALQTELQLNGSVVGGTGAAPASAPTTPAAPSTPAASNTPAATTAAPPAPVATGEPPGTNNTAYLPDGSVVQVQIGANGSTATQLPINSIVSVGGKYYQITGGSPGAYTSVQVSTPTGY
jgi:hypothetical protein